MINPWIIIAIGISGALLVGSNKTKSTKDAISGWTVAIIILYMIFSSLPS